MVSGCTWFYKVETGDLCYEIAADAGISVASFESMNPAVGSDCDILAGYYVCLGTTGSPRTITAGSPVASSVAAATTSAGSASSVAAATTSAGSAGSVPQPVQVCSPGQIPGFSMLSL
jgi:hypothetical protein